MATYLASSPSPEYDSASGLNCSIVTAGSVAAAKTAMIAAVPNIASDLAKPINGTDTKIDHWNFVDVSTLPAVQMVDGRALSRKP